MATFKALFSRVIIKVDPPVSRKIGMIEIPDNFDVPNTGVVQSIGPGVPDEPTMVKDGDKVIFLPEVGEKIVIDREEYLLMYEEDLIAII